MLVSKYLRDFVISGGIDPYADVIDVGRKTAKKQERGKGQDTNQSQSENGIAIENDLSYDEDVDDEVVTRTTVSSHRLSHWYNKSNALACMMNTGCFAYIEEKVCLDEPKYVERQDSGKMCLTAYAKEHEEECFLQFKMGADGKLHYIKLPESIADKEFHYTDYISEDILKQLGLVNEIAEQMLDVIRDMGFGDALRELMSNRVCNYSVNVLKDITGLDNNTIEKMWNDKSLTKVNVVSACLGLHLPFPVSSTLVEAAALTLNMFVGSTNAKAENRSYQGLLSTRWASEYDDIYDDLKAEGMETLIKTPPKAKTTKKKS